MSTAPDDRDPYAPLPPLPSAPATSLAALQAPEPALLGPLAPGSITLIRGPRGVGKSWLALAMAHAVASGGAMLGWKARAAPVLYVEAAMSGALLGARLRALGSAAKLQIVCDERLDLTETDDQARVLDALPEGGMLVLDGLSLLVRRGRNGWTGFLDWLRMLRRSGHAIVLVAPSARPALAALADTLIGLRRAEGEGVAFAVEIASRQPLAAADRAFTVELDLADGKARWRRAATVPPELREIVEAHGSGTVRDIAARLGLPSTTAWRRLERARALGLIEETSGTGGSGTSGTDGTAIRPAVPPASAPPSAPVHGTSGTAPDLAAVSTAVLKRTLARRKAAPAGQGRRPGPAILAGVADAALAAECARRLKPPQAERLLAQYAAE